MDQIITKKVAAVEIQKELKETKTYLILAVIGLLMTHIITLMSSWLGAIVVMIFITLVGFKLMKVGQKIQYLKLTYRV